MKPSKLLVVDKQQLSSLFDQSAQPTLTRLLESGASSKRDGMVVFQCQALDSAKCGHLTGWMFGSLPASIQFENFMVEGAAPHWSYVPVCIYWFDEAVSSGRAATLKSKVPDCVFEVATSQSLEKLK